LESAFSQSALAENEDSFGENAAAAFTFGFMSARYTTVFGAPYSRARERTPFVTTSKSSASTKDSPGGAGEQRAAMIERAATSASKDRENLSTTK
jgi:hypothetical protein